MKQCPKCSERNTNDSQFCKSCGENLENVEIISEDLSAMRGDKKGQRSNNSRSWKSKRDDGGWEGKDTECILP